MQTNKKKERLDISSIKELKIALKNEGYNLDEDNIFNQFNLDKKIIKMLYKCMEENDIIYRANDTNDFFEYIKTIVAYEDVHSKLCKKISEMKKIDIHRIEYEKEVFEKENVDNILSEITELKKKIKININENVKYKLEEIEKEIDEDYLYTKDIELLKKMITFDKRRVYEKYDKETQVKTVSIEVPEKIGYEYINPQKGSIEYRMHLNNNIPRLKRLIKNIHKYISRDEEDKFVINQGDALQDSINIAVALFDNKKFKAISGSTEINNYCKSPSVEEKAFKSSKVNRLGEIGVGYTRINDSEKKIFEEIHRKIESKEINDFGNLIIYTKWEPCLSCYWVISQFCTVHPNINVEVMYTGKYGSKNILS